MTAASTIRLLIVSPNPAMPGLLRRHLDGSGLLYRMHPVHSRDLFFEGLSGQSPDLVITHVDGAEQLNLREILQAAERHEHGIPVVVLGEPGHEQSTIRVLSKDSSDHLHLPEIDTLNFKEVDRLPLIIERTLRGQRARIGHLRLENELRHATGVLRESQRLVSVGRLAGSIAHEINNPLESVTNLLFLMEHEPGLPIQAQDYLKMAQKELGRVIRITKQALNFCRETASPVPSRLSQLIDEVLVLYARRIAEKQIEVIRRFGDEQQVTIFPGEIRQVFSNLITNAIEATGEYGKLYLRIRKSRLLGDFGVAGLRITVADTGTGMSPEVRRHIGEPFFTTKGQGGTGLGLWVSQSITERYGGNLLVRSSTGERHGTVFSIFLPINLRPRAVGPPDDPIPASAGSRVSGAGRAGAELPRLNGTRRERDPANKAG